MGKIRIGTRVAAAVVAAVAVACGASTDDAAQPSTGPSATWSDTTSTLGVTRWAMVPSDDDSGATLTGYDDAGKVRAQLVLDRTEDAEGNSAVRIRSVVQGPAVLEYRVLPDERIVLLQDTFRDHEDARRAYELGSAQLKVPGSGALTTRSLHFLDTAPLVGNQEQLICKDTKGNACTKPPDMGGATGVAGGCLAAAYGLTGFGCALTGPESFGAGCVVSAGFAAYGLYTCYDGLKQRANCKCVTPCADQCKKKFNRQYMCAKGSSSCSIAVANDRAGEASCVKGCGTGS